MATLALAIGATTVITSAVQAVFLRPLPIADPARLVVSWGSNPAITSGVIELSYLDAADIGRGSRTLDRTAVVASSAWPTVLDGLIVRTRTAPLALLPAIEREARALDPRIIVSRVETLDTVVSRARAPWRFSAWIFSVFALLALLLSTVGIAGLVALDVASRRHELAIRSALGAGTRTIVGGVLASALTRATAGIVIGGGLMLGATRALRALLFGVTAGDWPTYAFVLAVFGLVTLVATYLPARHAASTDPVALLRNN